MLYAGEERKVNCPICQTEVKEADCFDSTSISDLFYTTCTGCGFELKIEQGDEFQSVKPFHLSSEFEIVPPESQKPIIEVVAIEEKKIYSDRFETLYKSFNTCSKKFDLFRYDNFKNKMYYLESLL